MININYIFKDYYEILEVHRTASIEVIDKAYRTLALKHHPDKNPCSFTVSEEKMKNINEAYEVLGNDFIRQQYNQKYDIHHSYNKSNNGESYKYKENTTEEDSSYKKAKYNDDNESNHNKDVEPNSKVGKIVLVYFLILFIIIWYNYVVNWI